MREPSEKIMNKWESGYKEAITIEDYKNILDQIQQPDVSPLSPSVMTLKVNCEQAIKNLELAALFNYPYALRKPERRANDSGHTSIKQAKKKRRKTYDNPFPWFSLTDNQLWVKPEYKEQFEAQNYEKWHGAVIEEINEEGQSMIISGEEWGFHELSKFSHFFQATRPEETSVYPAETTLCHEDHSASGVSIKAGEALSPRCGSSGSRDSTPQSKNHRRQHVIPSMGLRNTEIWEPTCECCLFQLIQSNDCSEYIEYLMSIENWEKIVIGAFEAYHLIEKKCTRRAKTQVERETELQEPLIDSNVIKILEKISFEVLSNEDIEAYGRKISFLDLLFQTGKWDIIKMIIPEKTVPIKDVAWMHFAMSNSFYGKDVAINLAKKFENHQWTVQGLPPALFYYLIEDPRLDSVADDFKQFFSILVNSGSLSYIYNSENGEKSLFIEFIHKIATSNSRVELKQQLICLFKEVYMEDGLYQQWFKLIKSFKCSKKAYVFMAEIFIEFYELNLDQLHKLASHYRYKQTDCEYTKLTCLLSDLGEKFVNAFKEKNFIDEEIESKSKWVLPSKKLTGSEKNYQLAVKDIPAWQITPQIKRINRHVLLKTKLPPSLGGWVKIIFPVVLLDHEALDRAATSYKIIQKNKYPNGWVKTLYDKLGYSSDEEIPSLEKFRDTLNEPGHVNQVLRFVDRGICKDPLLKGISKITINKLVPPSSSIDGITFTTTLFITLKIDGEIMVRRKELNSCLENIERDVISSSHELIIQVIATKLNVNKDTITINGESLTINSSPQTRNEASSSSSMQSPPEVKFYLAQIACKQAFTNIQTQMYLHNFLSEVYRINMKLKPINVTLSIEAIEDEQSDIQIMLQYKEHQPIRFFVSKSNFDKKINTFFEIIEIMIRYNFKPLQFIGRQSIPLAYDAIKHHFKLSRNIGFDWSQCEFTSQFSVKIKRYPNDIYISMDELKDGLQQIEKGVNITLPDHYPISFQEITKPGKILSCLHVFSDKTLITASFTVKRCVTDRYGKIETRDIDLYATNDDSSLMAMFEGDHNGIPKVKHANPPFFAGDIITHIQKVVLSKICEIPNLLHLCLQCQRQVVPTEANPHAFFKRTFPCLVQQDKVEQDKNVILFPLNGKIIKSNPQVLDLDGETDHEIGFSSQSKSEPETRNVIDLT
jgi:hypothetical protein